jgi:hypothetical protein
MALVWGTYDQVCPKVVDLRVGRPGDHDAASAEKTARWTSGALVVVISLIAKDATVFIMGGTAVIAFSWMHRHANLVSNETGRASVPSSRELMHAGVPDPSGYGPVG